MDRPESLQAAVWAVNDIGEDVGLQAGGCLPCSLWSSEADPGKIGQIHVERLNLTLRTQLRRHTRRTSGHSKKLAHHQAALALLIAYYNFCRVHEGLCVTPAMEFGLTRSIWSVAELIQAAEATPHDLEPVVAPAYPRPGRKPFRLTVLRGGKMQ